MSRELLLNMLCAISRIDGHMIAMKSVDEALFEDVSFISQQLLEALKHEIPAHQSLVYPITVERLHD